MFKKMASVFMVGAMFWCLIGASGAMAGSYPEKPISIIVPYAPGGSTDVNARIIEKYAPGYLGVPIAIINKPGAGGAVGYTELATSKPDGYTIGYTNLPNMVQLVLEGNVHFKIEDFEPIAGQVKENKLIAVSMKSPFKTIEDLVEYAKANPGKLNGATSGPGSHNEMVLKSFCTKADIDMVLVPFKGDSGMKTALMGDHAQVMAIGTSGFDSEQFRALLLFSTEKDDDFPGLPTSFDKGYDLDMASSRVLQAPKGTPQEMLTALEDKFKKMFADPDYIADMKKAGAKPKMLNRDEVAKLIQQEKGFLQNLK